MLYTSFFSLAHKDVESVDGSRVIVVESRGEDSEPPEFPTVLMWEDVVPVIRACPVIPKMAVLSGDARHREFQYSRLAPDLKVVFNEKQSGSEPLTASFLKWFDDWVSAARKEGKVIAFRCRCGCHRTGRLAAYYQMKYQNLTAEDAIVIMNRYGVNMFLHPELIPQIMSLEDYIHDRPCSQP